LPYDNNPRINDGAVENVLKSISEFGFKVPIVLDKDYVIVTGHVRYKAARQMGLKKVPCIVASDLTEEQIKAYRLADNKTAEYAEWDMEKLEQELMALSEIGFDIEKFDFQLKDIASDDDFDFESAIESIEEPVTKSGDIWLLGRHRLLCGDSTCKKAYERLMNGMQAGLIITDPPYNVDYTGGTKQKMKIMNDSMPDDVFQEFLKEAHSRMHEALEPGAPIYVFHADSEGNSFRTAFTSAGFKLSQCLIWVKQSMVLGRQDYHWRHEPILYGWKKGAAHKWYGDRCNDTVIDEEKIVFSKAKKEDLIEIIKDMQQKIYLNSTIIYQDRPTSNADHPTMKPVKLIGKLMDNSSERGTLVLDPFGGSGSTLIASEQMGRTCNTMELDPKYCDVIVRRWEECTSQKAERIHGQA
jgi:site-specific DNA-methyltransferase (adenine-specific)